MQTVCCSTVWGRWGVQITIVIHSFRSTCPGASPCIAEEVAFKYHLCLKKKKNSWRPLMITNTVSIQQQANET